MSVYAGGVLRVTAALSVFVATSALARPPFPYEGRLRVSCARAGLDSSAHSYESTTCLVGADLYRAGPASLIIDVAGSQIRDLVFGATRPRKELELGSVAFGLDLDFGRVSGHFGVELLYRMAVIVAREDNTSFSDAQPFAYAGAKIGVGWRWLELGGTPFPRPDEPRIAHIAYGLDLNDWVVLFGLGLFGATVLDDGALTVLPPEFATYGELTGRLGAFDVGMRAALGGFQSLMLTVGWRMGLL